MASSARTASLLGSSGPGHSGSGMSGGADARGPSAPAALLVDPLDEGQIADAMQRISEDIALAHRLRHAGQARARLFSWDDTANLHIGMYQKILGIGQN